MTDFSDAGARLSQLRAEVGPEVEVVLVTKGFGAEAWDLARCYDVAVGENYAQEVVTKASEAPPAQRPAVHFIGQLQRNKVKVLADKVSVWQSVDSSSLVAELAKRAPGASVLIQVSLTDDPGRGGCRFDEVQALVAQAFESGLRPNGLMTVGIPGEPEQSRPAYRRLRRLVEDLGLSKLSAGMSNDYRIAVEEGSTMIRVGSLVLGDRPAQ